jgi:hypothetical protein
MGIEREDHSRSADLPSPFDEPADNSGVAQVHAIEVPDRNRPGAEIIG